MEENIVTQITPEHVSPEIDTPPMPPAPVRSKGFPTGKREMCFAAVIAVLSILMCNFVFYGGFHLGFAITAAAVILCSAVYLKASGYRFDWYTGSVLILCIVIAAGFGRSADAFVKLVMLLFLLVCTNLSLCVVAGQNRRAPDGVASLLDAPRALFKLGFAGMGNSGQGMVATLKNGSPASRKFGAVTTGLLISVPILVIMISLLMDADAAFEGLIALLPDIELHEYLISGFWGLVLGWILYSRGTALHHAPKPAASKGRILGVNALTVNTVLTAVCLVYLVYLFSQLAYLSGGISGILPEEYTMAEYARRGFFEMAWLCVLNLSVICGSVWLVKNQSGVPLFTKFCGAFIGGITTFLVITASAKMCMYIESYGLTRLRVMTEVIMVWLGITTVIVSIWLFLPKLPYMKAVVLTAMVMGALVFWVDVDTVVARYNVNAYRSGQLETIDVGHLDSLGPAVIPYLAQLTEDKNPEVARQAQSSMDMRSYSLEDFREWNKSKAEAVKILDVYHAAQNQEINAYLSRMLCVDVPMGTVVKDWNHTYHAEDGKRFLRVKLSDEEAEEFLIRMQAAGWEKLPISGVLRRAIIGNSSLFPEFRGSYSDSFLQKGYFFFTDLHPGAEDPSNPDNIFARESYRFILAYYSTDNQTLYYFEIDQVKQTEGT